MRSHHEKPLAAVIGAGVTGLTTALLLQCNGYDFPKDPHSPDYASTKAGAHWRSMCGEDEFQLQEGSLLHLVIIAEYDTVSYRTFEELSKEPKSGVKIRDAIDYYDYNPTGHAARLPWWSNIVKDFKQITGTTEFPIAYSYKTPVITPEIYLHFLLHQFREAGGHIQHRQLYH
ncbi:hypothetical protein BGZ94_002857, partial [Podila epigama]